MAGRYAERLNFTLVIMQKGVSATPGRKTTHVVWRHCGHKPIIIDDLMASGSVLKQLDALYERGAEGKAYFSVTHPVLSAFSTRDTGS